MSSSGCSSASRTAAPTTAAPMQVDGSWLGHRRLSIVDVERRAAAARHADESAWLVGNGEVYNHEEVRARLGDA